MVIVKSEGVTSTERLLAKLCEKSFLKLWSYPNPIKVDGDELCDLLAVFDNHVFIFFDRENRALYKDSNDPLINWNRWKKKAIDAQIRTAHGAERYIRSNRDIYLDEDLKIPFPFEIDLEKMVVHKIIVAHGAKEACEQFSDENVSGSLAISYGNCEVENPSPFMIQVEKEKPVHIFDSHNLPIIFDELNTFYDFASYLDAKNDAITKYNALIYCGEEDLLAHYCLNFDELQNKHLVVVPEEDIDFLMVGEGAWERFVQQEVYKRKKSIDEVSYLWDEIIQRTCQNALDGTLLGDSSPLRGKSAIHEMAKEPRFHRRALSEQIINAIRNFPEIPAPLMRNLSYMPSFYEGKAYIFLQLKVNGLPGDENEYRGKRQALLEIACGVAKNKFDHLDTIVGIAIDAPKFSTMNSEDFILLDCSNWPDEHRKTYEAANEEIGFFESDNLVMQKKTVTEYPEAKKSKTSAKSKVGRNKPCPCGSGKKYKMCCI